jgi:hypothetical protein
VLSEKRQSAAGESARRLGPLGTAEDAAYSIGKATDGERRRPNLVGPTTNRDLWRRSAIDSFINGTMIYNS